VYDKTSLGEVKGFITLTMLKLHHLKSWVQESFYRALRDLLASQSILVKPGMIALRSG
jgi:hypothetical protein